MGPCDSLRNLGSFRDAILHLQILVQCSLKIAYVLRFKKSAIIERS